MQSKSIAMNFNLLFAVVSSLFFSIEFGIDVNDRQDYFFFEGDNQTAHLARVNKTITLQLYLDEKLCVYKTNVSGDSFIFTWQGFLVNGEAMQQSYHNSENFDIHFENFTFISPIIGSYYNEVGLKPVPVYSVKNSFNYWYIVLIVFIFGVLFESKSQGMHLFRKLFLSRNLPANEHERLSIQDIRITDV